MVDKSIFGVVVMIYSSRMVCVAVSTAGGEARPVRLQSNSDVLGTRAAEASPRQHPQSGGHRLGEILQVTNISLFSAFHSHKGITTY